MSSKYENVRKILFVRLGAIGDVVHTTAAYQTVRQNIKNAIIDYLTSSYLQELINDDMMLRQIISVEQYSYEGFFRTAQNLADEHYELIVNFQPSLKTWFFTTVMNAQHVLTYNKFKPSGSEKHIHAVKNFYQTIEPLIPAAEMPKNLKLYLNQNTVKLAKHRMDSERLQAPIGIIPGASIFKRGRLWPKEYWIELLDYLTNQKCLNVIIFGGTSEFELASEMQKVNKNLIRNFCGKLSISQTSAILSLCTLVIGGDTGPTHIATAVGPRVIGLYGGTDPERTGLYGQGHEVLHSNYHCLFCERKSCQYVKDPEDYAPCMKQLSVDTVISSIGV